MILKQKLNVDRTKDHDIAVIQVSLCNVNILIAIIFVTYYLTKFYQVQWWGYANITVHIYHDWLCID